MQEFENQARRAGFHHIAGVDEAGRGPLAGPVVAAALMMEEGVFFEGINDSKLLTPQQRRAFFQKIHQEKRLCFGIGIVDVEEIDRINIYQASMQAMLKALKQLPKPPQCVLVDGKMKLQVPEAKVVAIIQGDRLSHSIAGASILAKVTRDELMVNHYDKLYPQYEFSSHKGYGTPRHLELLKRFGPSPIHRRTFAPVGALCA